MTNTLLELENITFGYKNKKVFSDLSLEISAGEKVLLIGSNGSGKTTLLRLMSGLLPVNFGTRKASSECKVGYKGHSLHCYLDLSPRENLKFYCNLLCCDSSVDKFLEQWGLEDSADKALRDLSQGQQQKLSLSISLLSNPNLLLLDEPSSNLDLQSCEVLLEVLNRPDLASVVASHDLNTFSPWCESVYVLHEESLHKLDKESLQDKYLEIIK